MLRAGLAACLVLGVAGRAPSAAATTTSWALRAPLRVPADPCNFTDATVGSSFGFVSLPQARACFASVPLNTTMVNSTLQSLTAMVEMYSYTDQYLADVAPWSDVVELEQQLQAVGNASLAGDFDFHSRLSAIFLHLNDAHTMYARPTCYRGSLVQPIGLVSSIENSRLVVRAGTLSMGGQVVANLPSAAIGAEIVAIDGVATLNALSAYADAQELLGSDPSSRMNALLLYQRFSIRSLATAALPSADNITYTLQLQDGSLGLLSIDWLVMPATSSMNSTAAFLDACAPPPPANSSAPACPTSSGAAEARRLQEARAYLDNAVRSARAMGDVSSLRVLHRAQTMPEEELTAAVRALSFQASVSAEMMHEASFPALRAALAAARARSLQQEGVHSVSAAADEALGTGKYDVDLADVARAFSAEAHSAPSPADAVAAGMQLLSQQTAAYGMYTVFDPNVNAVVLRLSTFSPPAIAACSSLIPPCPTTQDLRNYYACQAQAITGFVQYAQEAAATAMQRGATFAIDLTSNFGGFVVLGQALFMSLTPSVYAQPQTLQSQYQFRYSRAYASALQYVKQNGSAAGLLYPSDAGYCKLTASGSVEPLDPTNTGEWFTNGLDEFRGMGVYQYSDLFYLFSPFDVTSYVPLQPPALGINNFVLITDGLCGSMCSQFMKLSRWHGAARLLYVGGIPGVLADSSSFAGGFVATYSNVIASVEALRSAGWVPPAGVPLPVAFLSTASATVNLPSQVSLLDNSTFSQFEVGIADAYMRWYQVTTSSLSAAQPVYDAIARVLATSVTLPDGSIVGPVNAAPSSDVNPATGPRAAAIVLGVVAALAIIATLVLAFALCKSNRKGAAQTGGRMMWRHSHNPIRAASTVQPSNGATATTHSPAFSPAPSQASSGV